VPEPFIPKLGARIMSLQDPLKKMSKSDEEASGSINLFDSPEDISKKFRRAVTDSGTEIRFDDARPAITNLLMIYQLLTDKQTEEIEEHFIGKGYAHLKSELAEVTIEFLKPIQDRLRAIGDDELDRILTDGCTRAESIAAGTLSSVRERMGLKGVRRARH